jgi:hypothetical protein
LAINPITTTVAASTTETKPHLFMRFVIPSLVPEGPVMSPRTWAMCYSSLPQR